MSLGLLLCIVITTIRAQQYVFCRRAERLHNEIQALACGKATLADFQSQFERVGSVYGQSPHCTSDNCVADLRVGDFADAHWDFFGRHPRLLRMYGLFGGRLARVAERVEINKGVVRSKDYSLMVQVLPDKNNRPVDGNSFGYTLIGESMVSLELPQDFMARSRHEDYWIGWPSGCEGCVYIEVRFRAGISPNDIQRLGQFDFSCLTRWLKPCRDKGDIMPAAWAQSQRDGLT